MTRSKRDKGILAFLLAAAMMAGCAGGKTYVLEAPTTRARIASVKLMATDGAVAASDEMKRKFAGALKASLAEEPILKVSDDAPVTITYRFVYNDAGNPAVRVGSTITNIAGSPLYGLGDGAVALEVTYLNRDGKSIGRIVTDGPISGALGNPDEALKTAAKAIAAYTKTNYANMVPKKQ